MSKIPTAEEMAYNSRHNNYSSIHYADCAKLMKQFAELHVRAALKEASKKAETFTETYCSPHEHEWSVVVNRKSILEAYPLENIK